MIKEADTSDSAAHERTNLHKFIFIETDFGWTRWQFEDII